MSKKHSCATCIVQTNGKLNLVILTASDSGHGLSDMYLLTLEADRTTQESIAFCSSRKVYNRANLQLNPPRLTVLASSASINDVGAK